MPCSLDSISLKWPSPSVAVVAGLDAVDRRTQRTREPGDVGEVVQTLGVEVVRDGQGVLRADQVGAHHLDRAVGQIGRQVLAHRRHPVAEEDVDILVLHRRVGHRHRQHGDLGLVAEVAEQRAERGGRRRHVGPADV